MPDSEPSLLRESVAGVTGAARGAPGALPPGNGPLPARGAPVVYVAGLLRRTAAAAIDAAVVGPLVAVAIAVVGALTGVAPATRVGVLDIDLWIDLVLAADPALLMGATLGLGLGLGYLLGCHILFGRTLGMRALGIRVIDRYGDLPSPARCLIRCGGYVVGVATLFLGFLWIGLDSEKRGLHDWIAGTYVIRA
jgi:uncharacterized RDD family membrane protein YckC